MRKKLIVIAALLIALIGIQVQIKKASGDLIKSSSSGSGVSTYRYFPVFRLSFGSVPYQ